MQVLGADFRMLTQKPRLPTVPLCLQHPGMDEMCMFGLESRDTGIKESVMCLRFKGPHECVDLRRNIRKERNTSEHVYFLS